MKLKKILLTAAMIVISSHQARAQDIDFLKGLLSRIHINGYLQAGYEYKDSGDDTTSSFNIKRTVVWARGDITERWYFMFMYNFNAEVQEFYTDYRISRGKQLSVRVGQFKNSLSMENPIYPTQLELIDLCSQGVTYLSGIGSDPLYGVNYGRDLGIMLFGELFKGKAYYELAVMNGQGVNCSDGNSDKDLLVKLEYRPMPELRFVVSGQKGRGHAVGTAVWNPEIEVGDNYTRDRLTAGGEWKDSLLGLRGEALWGKDGSVKSWGAYLTGRLTVKKNLDIIASADFFDRNRKMEYDQTNLTLGVQYWYYKNCRVQLQYTRSLTEYNGDYNVVQAQVQVAL